MKTTLALIAAIGLAMPSIALAADESSTVSVRYADLNLETPEGQGRLDQRIVRAARQVCGSDRVSTGSRILPVEQRECVAKVVAETRQQVALAIESQGKGG